MKRVIISGGGTGGHIFPAIAIANCIKRRYPDCEILFVGALGKMEMSRVPQAGYKIVGLKIAGFQRKKIWKNISLPFKMMQATLQAREIIKDFNPEVVVGVGGYASWAILKQAQHYNIPTLLQEQNSYAGVSNKKLSKQARTICVAYDNMDKFFDSKKIVKTGNPVRKDIADMKLNLDNIAVTGAINTSKSPVIFVMGGSLGAKSINSAIEKNLNWFVSNNIRLIWQTGKYYYGDICERNKQILNTCKSIEVLEFVSDMRIPYTTADIIVSRAGALSISELCCVGKPVILVPSPNVAEDHQTKNAMALVNKDAAIMIEDENIDKSLTEKLKYLLDNIAKRNELSKNIKALAIQDADEKIVDEIEKII